MRRIIVLTILLAVLAGAFVLNLLLWRARPAADMPPALAAAHGQIMANVDLAGLTPDTVGNHIATAASDGARFVRIRVPWDEVQPQIDRIDWQTLDAAIDTAERNGLEIVLLLDGSPAWARAERDQANPLAPPHDVRDFGAFAEAIAARYGDRVDIYQLWDEPNIAPHWGAGPVDPQGYFTLLREGVNSIRRAAPDARIMLASLAPTTADDYGNLSDLNYLDRLYDLGAAELFDIVAAAAYGFDQHPDSEPAPDRLNFRRPELIYGIMQQHSDGDKPVWITAWGWWTPPPGIAADASPWKSVTEDEQIAYLIRSLDLARQQWPWAGPMAWVEYALSPSDDPLRAGFVLRQSDFAPTAAGAIMQSQARSPQVLGTGAHTPDQFIPADDTAWQASDATAGPAQETADLTISFTGRTAALEIQRGPYRGHILAWIDDRPAPMLPREPSGDAFISLYDPDNGVSVIPLATDLSPGEHVLRLQASGGWGQWFLRKFIVDHQPWQQPWPFWPIATVLALAMAVCATAWVHTVRAPGGRSALARLGQRWEKMSEAVRTFDRGWQIWLMVLLMGLFYIAPGLPLSLFTWLTLAVILFLRLDLAPALILVALPLYLKPKPLGPIGIPLHEILIWTAFGLWFARWFLDRFRQSPDDSLRLRRLDYPVSVLLFVGFFATLAAERRGFAIYDFRTVFLTPALFYWLLTRIERKRPLGLPPLGDGLVAGAFLLTLFAIFQLATGSYGIAEGVPRLTSLFGSANNLALYLGRAIPLLVIVAFLPLLSRQIPRSWRSWLYLLALIPIAFVAILTFSKGLLLISLPIGLITLAFFEKRLRWPAVIAFIVGLLLLIPLFRTERFADLTNLGSGTTFLRLQLWQSAWQMWLDHRWLGVGPDNFLYQYRSVYALPTAWEELNLSHPHNLFLDLLTRLGVLGFLAGIWLIAATLISGFRLFRPQPATCNLYLLGLYAGLVAGLAHGLIDNSLFLPDLMVLTLLVVGVVQRLGSGANPSN
ncbi:MAG: hypothetical protein J5I90_19380 [Caldilineales bacterium]|nr:hypothetical protein [Caldilineales bacterium]